jgi:hypothetical protein
MGFGQDPDTPGLAESVRRESEVFAESAAMMADAIGAKLDRMTFDVEFSTATGDSDLGFMQIPAGTVGGVYGYHRGWVGEKNVVSVGFNWTMGSHVTPPKPLEHGHVIQIFGTPNMRTVLHCLPPRDWTEPGFMGLGMIYTAMPVTNAVPAVVAAAPDRDAEGPARSPDGRRSSRLHACREPGRARPVQIAQRVGSTGHGHQQRFTATPDLRTLAMDQSKSVATSRSPRASHAPRMVGEKRTKSSAAKRRSTGIVRAISSGLRMSCWWIMLSVSATLPPNPRRTHAVRHCLAERNELLGRALRQVVHAEPVYAVHPQRPLRIEPSAHPGSCLEADDVRGDVAHAPVLAQCWTGPLLGRQSGEEVGESSRSSRASSSAVILASAVHRHAHTDRTGADVHRQHRPMSLTASDPICGSRAVSAAPTSSASSWLST